MKVKEVKDYIKKRMEEKVMSADEVLIRLADMARADISDFMDESGILDFRKVFEKGYLIKKVLHQKGRQSTIELHDSMTALNMLARHYALFTDKVQLDIPAELVALMEQLGLTTDDIRSDPLANALFDAAGVEIAGVAPDGTDSGTKAT